MYISPCKHTLRFEHQVLRIISFYPPSSGKLDHSPMQKWHRARLMIKPLYASEIRVGSTRMKV